MIAHKEKAFINLVLSVKLKNKCKLSVMILLISC